MVFMLYLFPFSYIPGSHCHNLRPIVVMRNILKIGRKWKKSQIGETCSLLDRTMRWPYKDLGKGPCQLNEGQAKPEYYQILLMMILVSRSAVATDCFRV